MASLISPEMARDINPHSGYLTPGTKFAHMNLLALFLSPTNKAYLARELFKLLTSIKYIEKIGKNPELAHHFKEIYEEFPRIADVSIDRWHEVPRESTLYSHNPIRQLHTQNLQFLLETSKTFLDNPEIVSAKMYKKFHNVNPETGLSEDHLYGQYTAKSYQYGVWKPEELFLNNAIESSPEWKLQDVHSEDPSRRWGRSLTTKVYNPYWTGGAPNVTSLTNPIAGRERERSGVRFWEVNATHRHYDRDNTDGLSEAGEGDRRVQIPHGYNLYDLTNAPSYPADIDDATLIDNSDYWLPVRRVY